MHGGFAALHFIKQKLLDLRNPARETQMFSLEVAQIENTFNDIYK